MIAMVDDAVADTTSILLSLIYRFDIDMVVEVVIDKAVGMVVGLVADILVSIVADMAVVLVVHGRYYEYLIRSLTRHW